MTAVFRIEIKPRASADLEAIYDYAAQNAKAAADALITQLLDVIDSFARLPHRHKQSKWARIRRWTFTWSQCRRISFFTVSTGTIASSPL